MLLAFAPYDYSLMAIGSLAVLFFCWQGVTPLRAAWRGFLFGLGLFGTGLSWVYISIHDFGGAGVFLSIVLTLLFASFWALFPALAAYLTAVSRRTCTPALRVILAPVIWIFIEYLRGNVVFNGFPLFQLAYSQLDGPLAGYIPVLGAYATGWLVALSASLLHAGLMERGRWLWLGLALLLPAWLIGDQLRSINWVQPAGEPIQVTLIQGNVAQDKKWQPQYRQAILQLYRDKTRQHWDSQVIIWPESAIPAFYHQVKQDYLLPLEREARQQATDLVLSLPVKNRQGEKFNTVMTFGRQYGVYNKIHLLPFGEYLPLPSFFTEFMRSLNFMPVGQFTAGDSNQATLEAGGYAFAPSICYEDAFGEENAFRLANAAYLVNVTNDGWFGRSHEPYQHMQMARMRALETQRYLLRATNNGLTAIVGPDGRIIQQAPLFTVATLTGQIIPMSGLTPYTRLGDYPVMLFLAVVGCGLLLSGPVAKWRYVKKRRMQEVFNGNRE